MDIAGWMVNTVSIEVPTGTADSYGQPVRGSLVTQACRVEAGSKIILGADNQAKQITKIWALVPIAKDTLVWLPGANTSDINQAHRVLTVSAAATKDGTLSLYEIWLE